MTTDRLKLFFDNYKHFLPPEAQKEIQEISEEYSYLKQIFNYSDWTISLVDDNGKYLIINPKMEKLIGNVVGLKVGSLSKKTNILEMISFLKKNPKESQVTELVDIIIDNSHKSFLIQMTRVNDKFLLMGSEITEIQEMKKQQEFNERMIMLGEMSSFIIHDINNPLNSISMSAELIEMMTQGQMSIDKIDQPVKNISTMVETISKIILTLKAFSRKEDSYDEEREIEFEKILNQSLMMIKPKLKQSYVNISSESDGSPIIGSEIEFLQVLVNLINNSIDAIKDNEEKWIKIIWKDSELTILDSGNGIDASVVPRLFEKFHTTKGSKGNGIGLYLSKEILNKNGYELEYKLKDNHTSFNWVKKSA
jgi:C4-dicarboxylate-specific signal transduction histidine kinase